MKKFYKLVLCGTALLLGAAHGESSREANAPTQLTEARSAQHELAQR